MPDDQPTPVLIQYQDGTWHDPADEPRRQMLRRRHEAYDIGHELNLLWDDIEAGRLGEAAKQGSFAAYVRDIKQRFPKPPDSA